MPVNTKLQFKKNNIWTWRSSSGGNWNLILKLDLRCELDLLMIFSKKVFWGATRPRLPPGMSQVEHQEFTLKPRCRHRQTPPIPSSLPPRIFHKTLHNFHELCRNSIVLGDRQHYTKHLGELLHSLAVCVSFSANPRIINCVVFVITVYNYIF